MTETQFPHKLISSKTSLDKILTKEQKQKVSKAILDGAFRKANLMKSEEQKLVWPDPQKTEKE